MTILEFKNFIEDCEDNDIITFCVSAQDNPVSEYYDVDMVYKIRSNNDNVMQVCLMPK
jgi:succinate dehydrogenase flavin-adding protein (antitoxin of CptAB toxin-antitoxin module)